MCLYCEWAGRPHKFQTPFCPGSITIASSADQRRVICGSINAQMVGLRSGYLLDPFLICEGCLEELFQRFDEVVEVDGSLIVSNYEDRLTGRMLEGRK